MVKRKRQQYGQKKKTTLRSKEKDNTTVKRKRQHYGHFDDIVVFFSWPVFSFSFGDRVVFLF
jgi:hypothetical protein